MPTSLVPGVVMLVGAASVTAGLGMVTPGAEANTAQTPATVAAANAADALSDRLSSVEEHRVSRSTSRPALLSVQRATKSRALIVSHQTVRGRVSESLAPTDPRDIARQMLGRYGWSDQFSCLDQLYVSESNWNPSAMNSSSGAYGIPQSLPGEKMATAGPDWRTNPATQLKWGLEYIRSGFGSPCNAWLFKQGHGWY